MDAYSSHREVEKVPKTRTERHQALWNRSRAVLQGLAHADAGMVSAFGRTPVSDALRSAREMIEQLAAELKVPR